MMGKVRVWYVYLVSAITLQALTWAAINLLRNLTIPGINAPVASIAFQISVIVITLSLFLVHWLWAQRSAARDPEERASLPRLLYLYIMMTAFLAPLVNNAYGLVRAFLQLILGVAPSGYSWRTPLSPSQSVWYNLVPLIVLGLLWFYHRRVRQGDEKVVPQTEAAAIVRQLYLYLFAAIGLGMSIVAVINLLEWLLNQLFLIDKPVADAGRLFLTAEAARLIVGLPLWLIFWLAAQRLFYGPDEQERESVVRKAYLYLLVFISVMAVVITVTVLLSDILSRLLGLAGSGGDLSLAIALVVTFGSIWAYHAYVLRGDAAEAKGQEEQALVRRIYLYLTAGIGLAAVLTGLVGDLNVLIRAMSTRAGLSPDLREPLAYFTAVLLAGLPLWLINWRRIQQDVNQEGPAGQAERRALVRRIYLYFYLFVATMAVLGSAIYILSQVVELILGARSSQFLLRDLGQALAFIIIAALVWLYHGSILRRESRQAKEEDAAQLRSLRVAVVDAGDGHLGQALVEQLQQQVPSAQVQPLGLTPAAAAAMNDASTEKSIDEILAEAEVIVGPWNMAVSGAAGGQISESIAHGITGSPARKVLIPVRDEGWEWTGVERWKSESVVKEATNAVKQMAIGQEVKTGRRNLALTIVIVLVVLCILLTVLPSVVSFLFFGW
jgi:hypothetical protein